MRCEDRAGVDPGRASSPSSTSQARRSPSTTRQLPHEHAHTDAVGCSLGFVAPRCAGGRVCGLRPDLGRRRCHGVIDSRDMFGDLIGCTPLAIWADRPRVSRTVGVVVLGCGGRLHAHVACTCILRTDRPHQTSESGFRLCTCPEHAAYTWTGHVYVRLCRM